MSEDYVAQYEAKVQEAQEYYDNYIKKHFDISTSSTIPTPVHMITKQTVLDRLRYNILFAEANHLSALAFPQKANPELVNVLRENVAVAMEKYSQVEALDF